MSCSVAGHTSVLCPSGLLHVTLLSSLCGGVSPVLLLTLALLILLRVTCFDSHDGAGTSDENIIYWDQQRPSTAGEVQLQHGQVWGSSACARCGRSCCTKEV